MVNCLFCISLWVGDVVDSWFMIGMDVVVLFLGGMVFCGVVLMCCLIDIEFVFVCIVLIGVVDVSCVVGCWVVVLCLFSFWFLVFLMWVGFVEFIVRLGGVDEIVFGFVDEFDW